MPDTARAKITLFLILTALFSGIVYWLILARAAEDVAGLSTVALLMWSPGIAAIITRLVTQRNLRGMGWTPGPAKALLMAYALPLLYATPIYVLTWVTGIGIFNPEAWQRMGAASPAQGLLMLATLGVLNAMMRAAGEEIGWRGLLAPELLKITSFRRTALISGAIWAAWHMPLLIFAGYSGEGTPVLFSMVCFTVTVIGLGYLFAWLTLWSGSVWPAIVLHATHNLFVQGVFDRATKDPGGAQYLTGEFGLGLAAMGVVAMIVIDRHMRRKDIAASR